MRPKKLGGPSANNRESYNLFSTDLTLLLLRLLGLIPRTTTKERQEPLLPAIAGRLPPLLKMLSPNPGQHEDRHYVPGRSLIWYHLTATRHRRHHPPPSVSTPTLSKRNNPHEQSILNADCVTRPTHKWQTRPLFRDGAPNWQNCNFHYIINIWSWAPDGARHQDRPTDWPSVVTWPDLTWPDWGPHFHSQKGWLLI
jgi:hypothetical protein